MKFSTLITIILAALTVPSSVSGEIITIDATDRGWYSAEGTHFPELLNYFAGDGEFDASSGTRNWFFFDLSSITQPILSAELHLDNSDYVSADPFETFVLHNVTTNLNDLVNGLGGVAAFDDLGSGTLYGDYNATTADIFSTIIIDLNTAALSDLNAAFGAGGMWATGGSITTLDNDPLNNEFIFALTGGFPLSSTRLVITTIPVAPGLPVLLVLPLFIRSRRRLTTHHVED